LLNNRGEGIQIKATSNKYIKGNKISPNEGYYIAVKYERKEPYEIVIREILAGRLSSYDWSRPEGTQSAFLKKEAAKKLMKIYP